MIVSLAKTLWRRLFPIGFHSEQLTDTTKVGLKILSAQELMIHCGLDPQLNDWRSLSGVDNHVFDQIFLDPFRRYAEVVQLAPASESHHHSGPGGLLKHTTEVITIALKKRRGYQLPLGGTIKEISDQKHLWTYGVFVACLLHDVGKLSASIRITVHFKDGTERLWTPHDEPLTHKKQTSHYTIGFHKIPYEYHHRISLTHFELIPQSARGWLMQAPALMMQLCAYLWGDRFESGIIGEIAEFADRESTARNLQLPSDKRFSAHISAIDRYLKMIRQWISDGAIKINVNGGMGFVDHEGYLYLVCRSLAEKIIQECASLGLKQLPQDHVRVYDILQEHGYALSTAEGKAIWNVNVKTSTFNHTFTCLKFEARRFSTPSKPLVPISGAIEVVATKSAEVPLSEPQTVLLETDNIQGVANEQNAEDQTKKITQDTPAITKVTELNPSETVEVNIGVEWVEPQESDMEMGAKKFTRDTDSSLSETEAIKNGTGEEIRHASDNRTLDLESHDTPRQFLGWLKKGLIEKTILINDVNAEVHIVDEGVFLLAPAIFKSFLNKHGHTSESNHKNLSRRFARLRVHIRNGDLNIHSYWAGSNNRVTKISGWLLPFNVIYENDYPIPKPNKYIRRSLEMNN